MIKALLFDFARTLIFPTDKNYKGGINDLHKKVKDQPDFKFFDYFELNTELMGYLKVLKATLPVYLFTSDAIQNDPAIKDEVYKLFTKVFSAKEMGMSKKDPDAYKFIAKDLNLEPPEIIFVDDNSGNVGAAKSVGMEIMQYKDNGLIQDLKDITEA